MATIPTVQVVMKSDEESPLLGDVQSSGKQGLLDMFRKSSVEADMNVLT